METFVVSSSDDVLVTVLSRLSESLHVTMCRGPVTSVLLSALQTDGNVPTLALCDTLDNDALRAVADDIRSAGYALPLIGVSARPLTPGDMSELLDSGYDYVIESPFRLEVLVARIQALRRRAEWHAEWMRSVHRIGNIVIHEHQGKVWINGVLAPLIPRERELLIFLSKRAEYRVEGDVIARDVLDKRYERKGKYLVRVFASRVRKHLRKYGASHTIRSVFGSGAYILSPVSDDTN